MTLTVEDGTGVTGADSLITLQYFMDYCLSVGYITDDFDSVDDIEPAIRRGSKFISNAWTYKGVKTYGRDQVFAFPRSELIDKEGFSIGIAEIPVEIQEAVAESSWFELNNPNTLSPSVVLTQQVKRKKIGSMEKEFFAAPMSAEASKPVLTLVEDLIGGFLDGGASNMLVGDAVRR